MTLDAAAQMRKSPSLKRRIESAAYSHEPPQTTAWVDQCVKDMCATPEWATAWMEAWTTAVEDGDVNRDLGINRNVITDEMIESAVGAQVDKQQPPTPEPAVSQADYVALAAEVADLKAQLAAVISTNPAAAPASDGATA